MTIINKQRKIGDCKVCVRALKFNHRYFGIAQMDEYENYKGYFYIGTWKINNNKNNSKFGFGIKNGIPFVDVKLLIK